MTYNEIKEVYTFFNDMKAAIWGEYSKADIRAFLTWLEHTEDMKAISWTRFDSSPYDLDDFFEEFKIENGFEDELEDIESQLPWYDETKDLQQAYYKSVL